jgi:hypothetical protein
MDGLHHNCTTESDTFRPRGGDHRGRTASALAGVGEGPDCGGELRAGDQRDGGGAALWAASQSDFWVAAPVPRRCGGRCERGDGLCPGGDYVVRQRAANRIEVISGGVTIRVGAGFDAGDLRRVLLVVRELG